MPPRRGFDEPGAQHGAHHGGPSPSRRCSAILAAALAPLAQTAEHFHGKEGVYGSIP